MRKGAEIDLSAVDEYYQKIRELINQVNKAVSAARILEVSLFDLEEVVGLRRDLAEVDEAGQRVGIDNTVALLNSDALINELSRSPERCRFYKNLAASRLAHKTKTEPSPPSLKELEERFQFRCFKGRRIKAGLGMGTRDFQTWKESGDYTGTFYDKL